MRIKEIYFTILIVLSTFQVYCQVGNDIDKPDINWHHEDMTLDKIPGISTKRAYNELLPNKKSTKIIVAVLDDGLDIELKDLKAYIWTNIDEIPDNNIDDDNNGYIDDIHGWNFLGNADGENLLYDTWEQTRTYISLHNQFTNIDTTRFNEKERAQYAEYLQLKEELETKRATTKSMYTQWKKSKEGFDHLVDQVGDYTNGKKITLELLETLEITNDSSAQKANNTLIKWYKAGYSKEMIDKKCNSLYNQYEYNLNPDYDSRSIIGDDPNDLEDRNYGNPNVSVPGTYHGTSVSAIIGAIRLNGIGIDGIADNIEIMPVRLCPFGDERDKDVANAIYYAVDNGAKILNMSFGKSYSPDRAHVEKAIRYAEEKGVLLISGSGNNGEDIDEKPRYPNNETFLTEGTSISAPMVSGVAALLWSYFPDLTALEIKNIILESAEYYGDLEVLQPGTSDKKVAFKELSKTGGIVNAYNAIKLAEKISDQQ